ncbi:MAG: hypothetical protein Q7S17_00025, partial [Xanthobacteraceae bacterium]|nr:hypothetical protein [Xanthobacteraceae bacterium]
KRKGWPSAYAMGIDSGGNLIWGGGDRWGSSNFAAETAVEQCARSSGDFCKVLMVNGEFREQGFLEIAQRLRAQNPDAMRQAYLQSLRQPYTESRYGTTRNPIGYGFSSPRDSRRAATP